MAKAAASANDGASHAETPARLIYSRQQVAEMLGGISTASVRRLEREGRLQPIRLGRSPTAMVFFRASDIEALVAGVAND